ncbi:MAG: hypothetical protein ACRDYA_05945 [Egibacteraceae bacterium]
MDASEPEQRGGSCQRRSGQEVTGPALIGEEQRLCVTPCHHVPIRFTDGRVPPIPQERVACPRGNEEWTVEFPATPAGEGSAAVWRR